MKDRSIRRSGGPRGRAFSIFGWLLVWFLCFDVISGPFHAHSHDVGADGLILQVVHAADHGDRGSTHAEDFDQQPRSHSVAALIPAGMRMLEGATLACAFDLSSGIPASVDKHVDETVAIRVWPVAQIVQAQTSSKYALPESRAPPATHV